MPAVPTAPPPLRYLSAEDVLSFTNQLGITGSWNPATGTLTLTGAATLANYQTALVSITYTSSSDNPSTLTRTVTFKVDDGSAQSSGATRQVTFGPGQQWVHSWAPDSDHVAVARLRNGVWNLWSVSVSTGDEQPLTSYTLPSAHVRYPAWSPRGDRIVYEFGEVHGNVWVSRVPE